MENEKRILWLDNLKGIMIFLVLISHCLYMSYSDPVTQYGCMTFQFFFLSFFSYVFYGVSGYLYEKNVKRNSEIKFLVRRVAQLLVPTVIVSIANVLVFSGCKLKAFPYTGWNLLFNESRFSTFADFALLVAKEAYSYWFMWIIAAIYIAHYVLKKYFSYKVINGITVAVYCIAVIFKIPVLGKFIISYWGFLIGIMLARNDDSVWLNRNRNRIMLISMFIYLIYSIIVYWLLGYDCISNCLVKMPMAVSSTIFFLLIFEKYGNVNIKFLSVMGQESLAIYLIHWELYHWIGDKLSLLVKWEGINGILLGLGLSVICAIVSIVIVRCLDHIPVLHYIFRSTVLIDKITSSNR